jgi:hypothetical protein
MSLTSQGSFVEGQRGLPSELLRVGGLGLVRVPYPYRGVSPSAGRRSAKHEYDFDSDQCRHNAARLRWRLRGFTGMCSSAIKEGWSVKCDGNSRHERR